MSITTENRDCQAEFRDGKIHCKIHGRKSYPAGYVEDSDKVRYSCSGMQELRIRITDIPDASLTHLYRKVKKTNNSIIRDNGDPRHTDLVARLSEEIKDRDIDIPNTSLTHKVTMNKRQSLESDIPAIVKIGTADGKYDFGTKADEITWSVLVTEEEAETLQNQFENVRVQEVSTSTKK